MITCSVSPCNPPLRAVRHSLVQIWSLRRETRCVNYAPMAQLNYRREPHHNCVFATMAEPSKSSKCSSPVVDVSDPLNISSGNPDLKPSFQHGLNLRYQMPNFRKLALSMRSSTEDIWRTTLSEPPLRTSTQAERYRPTRMCPATGTQMVGSCLTCLWRISNSLFSPCRLPEA